MNGNMFVKLLHLKGIQRILYMFIINKLLSGTEHFKAKAYLLNSLGCHIGEDSKIVGPIYFTTNFSVGKNTWIGSGFSIHGNGSVEIGNNCDIAPDVSITTGSHIIGTSERRAGEGINYSISIGDGTWVGNRVTIINDTTIGSGCVIAACACVVSNVEDNTLVGGVPAKLIKKI